MKKVFSTILAFSMILSLFPGQTLATVGNEISNLFHEGDTGNLLAFDDFSFLGHSISVLSVNIATIKDLMIENEIGKLFELTTFDEDGMIWIGGDVTNSKGDWVGNLSVCQTYDDTDQMDWQFSQTGDEQCPIGIGNISTNDSLETVLRELGFSNAFQIAQKMNEIACAGYDTSKEAMESLDSWSYNAENGVCFREGGGHTAYQADDGKWFAGWIQLEILFHGDDFGYRGELQFEDDKLTQYSGHKWLKTQASAESVSSSDLDLPTDQLAKVSDISSAVEAISYLTNTMTSTQKTAPTCIDLATLYTETASSKAAAQSVASNNILINVATLSGLESTAVKASEAVEAALTNGGVTTARYLSKTVILRTEENDITVYVDPDALTTAVDKVRVETPSYALTFKLADLAPDLTQPLIFTAKLPSAKPADSDIGAVQSLSMGDMESQVVTKSILANAAAPAVEIDMPGGKTTNSITVSLPGDGGDTMYQAVVSTDGQATASKYNPVTTTMDGKINASGTYTVKSNEKDFTDIANKSAEMQKAIRYLASKGIISGTTATTFSPDGSINRAEIATLLVKALGKLDSTAAASFSDVTKGNWFYTAAASSQRHKLINGYEDNTFRGTTNISKVQIVSVSSRVLKTEMGYKEPSSPANYLVKYSDTVASWAQPEVALATKENLVVYRTDGTFSGDKAMTRGDAAIIIYRLFQRIW